jgi:hypothetical protein
MTIKNKSNKSLAKPLLIFLYPWRFTKSQYKFLEIKEIKNKVQVEIWDLSKIISIDFYKNIKVHQFHSNKIFFASSYLDFFCRLYFINRNKYKIYIISQIPSSYLIINFLLLIYSKFDKVEILSLFNSGVPLLKNNLQKNQLNFFCRLFKYSISFKSAFYIILRGIRTLIGNKFFYPATKILTSGIDWFEYAQKHFEGIQIIKGNSHDYSNFLLKRKKNNTDSKPLHIVFLDCGAPLFASDSIYLKRKEYLTTNNWYPSLCNFFNFLENKYKLKVVIAGHYKSKHQRISPFFGNRPVYYGKTCMLIKNSLFVVNVNSTAISFAITLNKPVLSIVSKELIMDSETTANIYSISRMLGTSVFNIDGSVKKFNLKLSCNKKLYEKYKYKCLTSPGIKRSNAEIILSDFIGIK